MADSSAPTAGTTLPIPSIAPTTTSAAVIEQSAAKTASSAKGGLLMISGSVSYSLTGRSAPPTTYDGIPETNLWSFHRIASLTTVPIAHVYTSSQSVHFIAVTPDGQAYVWGRNERGQLGLGHTRNVYTPVILPVPWKVAHAATGRTHTIFVTTTGEAYAAGDNKMGQCALGKATPDPVLTPALCYNTGPGKVQLKRVSAGVDFTIGLDANGIVYTAGSPQNGQCGSGSTGEYIVSAGRLGYAEIPFFKSVPIVGPDRTAAVITDVSAGANHGAALGSDGRVWTWGAGGYGRCGHGVTADALVPTLVKVFEPERMRVKSIACGGSASFYVTRLGSMTYMSGITKKTGEACMIPKPIQDLAGWNPIAMGIGITSVIMAMDYNRDPVPMSSSSSASSGGAGGAVDDGSDTALGPIRYSSSDPSVISWGPSPTCGELGYGAAGRKSSTKPDIVTDFNGLHVLDCAMSQGLSLVILDVFSDTPHAAHARSLLHLDSVTTVPGAAATSAASSASSGDASSAQRFPLYFPPPEPTKSAIVAGGGGSGTPISGAKRGRPSGAAAGAASGGGGSGGGAGTGGEIEGDATPEGAGGGGSKGTKLNQKKK